MNLIVMNGMENNQFRYFQQEHMASHTGHDLYTCLYCPKTFKASTNKYKHQREVHTEQWQLDRKRQNYKLC